MEKVLVANRGEIALRISRAVQEMGMQAVRSFQPMTLNCYM